MKRFSIFQVIEFGEFSKQLKIDLSGVKVEMVFGEIKIKRILSKSDTVGKLCFLCIIILFVCLTISVVCGGCSLNCCHKILV